MKKQPPLSFIIAILMKAWYCHLLQSKIYSGGLRTLKMFLNLFHKVIRLTHLIQIYHYKNGELFFMGNDQKAAGYLMKLARILIALN